MVLVLENEEVQRILDMGLCMAALDEAYQDLGMGSSSTSPRIDILTPQSYVDPAGIPLPGCHMLKTMSAATPRYAAIRFLTDHVFWREASGTIRRERTPATKRGHSVTRGLILLFSVESGDLVAMISEGHIRNLRVGAAAGLAARHLATEKSTQLGLLGSGFMARAHVEAIQQARAIESLRVFSPSAEHRQRFAQEIQAATGIKALAVDAPGKAVRGSQIVVLATNALTPVLDPDWLEPGMYVCSVRHCEIAPATFSRFDVLTVNSKENLGPTSFVSRSEEVTLPDKAILDLDKGYPPGDATNVDWQHLPDLPDLLLGRHPGRTNAREITCFDNSVGFGLQFAACAEKVYEAANERGIGKQIPDDIFPDLF
jgi:ornithine cyclodeaminase/alanine dehydrogenase-like protein (mu-crystallin family)